MILEIPERHLPLVTWLRRSGQFDVKVGAADRVTVIDERPLLSWPAFDSAPAALAAKSSHGFVIARSLSSRDRSALEERGFGYADASGRLFFRDGPVLIRVDDPTLRREPFVPTNRSGIGYAGVRIVQELLADPREAWTVSMVERSAAVSKGRASEVLQLLDQEGLTQRVGRGTETHRVIVDPNALLDWTARQPKARAAKPRLECALYARDELDAVLQASERLAHQAIGFSITGSAAARFAGARVLTSAAARLRVDHATPLAHACDQIGGTPVKAGGNLVLIEDIGRVGTVRGEYPSDDDRLARPARIYLDLLTEPRGESAAELFRDLALTYDEP